MVRQLFAGPEFSLKTIYERFVVEKWDRDTSV
jgi:hypothetical protein